MAQLADSAVTGSPSVADLLATAVETLGGSEREGQQDMAAAVERSLRTGEHLAVQAPAGRLAAWSTDARAGTPLLPDLAPGAPDPVCVRTVRAGVVLHDALG